MISFPIAAWWAGGQRRKISAALASGHALENTRRGNRVRGNRGEQTPTVEKPTAPFPAGVQSFWPPKILEGLPLGLAVISLVLGCWLVPPQRGRWNDEHYNHYGLSQSSLADTISLSGDLLNASPPMYFILAWGWKSVFGMSLLSLRLFACLGCAGAMVALWCFLKKAYTPLAASIGVVTTFLLCDNVIILSKESRHYGLYLLEVTLLLILHCRINVQRVPSILALGGLTLLHGLLVTTHYFGVPYSGMLLLAALAYRLIHGLPVARIGAAAALGWLALAPCLAGFRRHLEFSNPHGWIPPPDQADLWRALAGHIAGLPLIMLILAFLIAILFLSSDRRNPAPAPSMPPQLAGIRLSLLISGAAILAVPVVTWLKSIYFGPMFLDRYFFPTVLTWAILVTQLADLIWSRLNSKPSGAVPNRLLDGAVWFAPRAVLVCGMLLLPRLPILDSLSMPNVHRSAAYDALADAVPGPIVVECEQMFLDRIAYATDAQRYFLVLDWEVALSPQADRGEVNVAQILTTCRRRCGVPNILTTKEFFDRFSAFTVIRATHRSWSKLRILKDPAWQVEPCEVDGVRVLKVNRSPLTAQSPAVSTGDMNPRR